MARNEKRYRRCLLLVDTGQAGCMTSNKNKFVIIANGIVVSTPCHYWSIVYGMCDHLLFVANSNSIILQSFCNPHPLYETIIHFSFRLVT